MILESIKDIYLSNNKSKTWKHVQEVAETAVWLAEKYSLDTDKIKIAALLQLGLKPWNILALTFANKATVSLSIVFTSSLGTLKIRIAPSLFLRISYLDGFAILSHPPQAKNNATKAFSKIYEAKKVFF